MKGKGKTLQETIDSASRLIHSGNYDEALRLTRTFQKLAPRGWASSNNVAGLLIDIGCDTNRMPLTDITHMHPPAPIASRFPTIVMTLANSFKVELPLRPSLRSFAVQQQPS